MGLFTRYKSNFKKQAWWNRGFRFVYSHPNSKHLEFSLCFPLISAALSAAQAPSRVRASSPRRTDSIPGSVLVVCAHQSCPGASHLAAVETVSPSAAGTQRRVLGTPEGIAYISADKIL